MTPYQLKRSILTAAIQGKITKQDENEGTGAELLAANAVEKKRRIADEKVKSGKPCRPITEDDTLFDIPSNWSWARFGDLVLNFDSRRRPVTKEDRKTTKGLYDYYGATGAIDRVDEYIFDGEFLMIGEDGGNFFVDRDNSFIANGQFWANNHVHVVQPIKCEIWYLKHCLDAYNMPNMGLINGIAVPKLNQENLNSIMIPVPPLAEQKRIVAKIEELLPLLDRYEQAWSKLEDFNKRFPVDMQKSILQMANQGKLVEQRPEEGTGDELYQQIQAEKQAMIKVGKIKKEKPLPYIAEDEIPFDIPESWKWVRFSELMNSMSTGPFGSMLHKSDYVEHGIPLVNPANIVNGQIVASDKMMVSSKTAKRLESYMLRAGMIIMGRRGEMGRCAVVREKETGWLCGTGSFFMAPSSCVFVHYISVLFTTSYAKTYLSGASVGTTMNNLNHKILSSMPIPLPPLAEQKRIVAKLEEILPLCERLK